MNIDSQLCVKGQEYYDMIIGPLLDGRIDIKNCNMMLLLRSLDEISVSEGFVLDYYPKGSIGKVKSSFLSDLGYYPEDYYYNYNVTLYCHRNPPAGEFHHKKRFRFFQKPYDDSKQIVGVLDSKESKDIPEIWKYLSFPSTPMGFWQATLLRWIENALFFGLSLNQYRFEKFFFCEKDISECIDFFYNQEDNQESFHKMIEILGSTDIFPHVEMVNKLVYVTFCSWSYHGLCKDIYVYEVKKDRSAFIKYDTEVLLSANLDVHFL